MIFVKLRNKLRIIAYFHPEKKNMKRIASRVKSIAEFYGEKGKPENISFPFLAILGKQFAELIRIRSKMRISCLLKQKTRERFELQ